MNQQNSLVLLNRLLSVKENTPFILLLDSLVQSSQNLVKEIAYKCTSNRIIYLSYETINKPSYADEFKECINEPIESVFKFLEEKQAVSTNNKTVIIVDSLNYIAKEDLTRFIATIALPTVTIVATYHTNCPQKQDQLVNFPSAVTLLSYIANTIFEIEVDNKLDEESVDNFVNRLHFPPHHSFNSTKFKVVLTNRRKSGRSIRYNFIIDTKEHTYDIYNQREAEIDPEDELLLKDLTTFNLITNSKQKLAKDQVQLPFMEAQESMGAAGGAIVYEFEKDDDYDEEDPYEDPF